MGRMLLPLLLVIVVAVVVMSLARARGRAAVLDAPPSHDDRAAAVARAQEWLRLAEQRHAARLASAEEELVRARQDVEVMRLGPVVLGRSTVMVSGREHELTEATLFGLTQEGTVTYRVDEEDGRSRIVGEDGRTGRLTVEGEGWQEEVEVLPDDLAEAERLVAAGRASARSVTAARRERAERVERAWASLEEARAGRAEVDAARMTVEDLKGSGPWVWDVPEPPEEE